MSNSSTTDDKTLTLSRTFDAPISLVWEAWTNAKHIAQWWGPKGMETKIIRHEFKMGGSWEYAMTMPDGNAFIADGVYTLIVEMEKIFSSANFKPMTEGVEIQALFEANGEKTNFIFNVVHPSAAYCQAQEKMGFMSGWGSVFDRLEAYFDGIK